MMKIQPSCFAIIFGVLASTEAFAPSSSIKFSTQLQAEIGETGVSFENVAREWRCKVRLTNRCRDCHGISCEEELRTRWLEHKPSYYFVF